MHRSLAVAFLFMLILGWKDPLSAQEIQAYEEGPIHEAFIEKIVDTPILEAIAGQPPEPINERIPRQTDMQATWISGYWSWDAYLNDFVWVSGVWRRPPPGRLFVSGFWKQYESGWVWIPGYWSHVPSENTAYIGVPPPDPIDENMAALPSDSYFWAPGYWIFLFDQQNYQWVPGKWEELDPNWVYVRSHYVWRPGGYVFVPAYWDWSIEERGTPYVTVKIDPFYRYRIVYEPTIVLKQPVIFQYLFTCYPDYLLLLHHNYHYNPHYWDSFCCVPPWWNWGTWWGLTWQEHWGLWWWYSHPGYPQPLWLSTNLSAIMPQPLAQLPMMLAHVKPPLIVTPNGVASQGEILHALQKTTGNFSPILPNDVKELKRVQQLARPVSLEPQRILRPLGKQLPLDPRKRPHVRKPVIDHEELSRDRLLKEDRRPKIPFKPRIPLNGRESIWQQEGRERVPQKTPQTPPERRPIWVPRSPERSANPPIRQQDDNLKKWKPSSDWGEGGEPPIKRAPVYQSPQRRDGTRNRTRNWMRNEEGSPSQGVLKDAQSNDLPFTAPTQGQPSTSSGSSGPVPSSSRPYSRPMRPVQPPVDPSFTAPTQGHSSTSSGSSGPVPSSSRPYSRPMRPVQPPVNDPSFTAPTQGQSSTSSGSSGPVPSSSRPYSRPMRPVQPSGNDPYQKREGRRNVSPHERNSEKEQEKEDD